MSHQRVITVCQLAFESEFHASYDDPALSTERAVWDAAWLAAERAAQILHAEVDRLRAAALRLNP